MNSENICHKRPSKAIFDYFIENKVYLVVPFFLYFLLWIATLFSILSTLSENKITKICFSEKCLNTASTIFDKTIKMHFAGLEYLYYLTAIISVSLAVYSYVISSQASINNLKANNLSIFSQIVKSTIPVGRNIEASDINLAKLYYFIYQDTDEGNFKPSQHYINNLVNIKNSIDHFNRNSSKINYPVHAQKIIEATKKMGISFSNRGRRLFHEDELSLVIFLNELNKIILIDNPIKISERKFS